MDINCDDCRSGRFGIDSVIDSEQEKMIVLNWIVDPEGNKIELWEPNGNEN